MRHGFDHRLGESIYAFRPLIGCWLFLFSMAVAYMGSATQLGGLPADAAGLTDLRSWTSWLVLCLLGAGASLAVYSRRPWLAVLPPLLLVNGICFYWAHRLGALNPHQCATLAGILLLVGVLPALTVTALVSAILRRWHSRQAAPLTDETKRWGTS